MVNKKISKLRKKDVILFFLKMDLNVILKTVSVDGSNPLIRLLIGSEKLDQPMGDQNWTSIVLKITEF